MKDGGEKWRFIPCSDKNLEATIFGKIINCLKYVRKNKHPLKMIKLQFKKAVDQQLLNEFSGRLANYPGWKCETEQNNFFHVKISQM